MGYTYKQLRGGDEEHLKKLLRVFGEAFEEIETYQGAIPSDDYLRKFLTKDHTITLVAFADDEVVGGLVAYELTKFEQERSEIYIYDLAVSESHRRQGIATSLIRLLREIGKTRGAYVVFVQADPGDDPAIRLYESLGKREDVHHFDIPVV